MPEILATFCRYGPALPLGTRPGSDLGTKKSPSWDGLFIAKADSAYFSKDSTDCGCWLACASMAVAACWMIWFLDSWLEAVA
jgi:hypothetical protein